MLSPNKVLPLIFLTGFLLIKTSISQKNNGTCRTISRILPTRVEIIYDNITEPLNPAPNKYKNFVPKGGVSFKLGNPNITFTLLPRDYDVLRADKYPKDVMLDFKILHFTSLQTTQQVKANVELFEAQANLVLEWVDTRINSVEDLRNISKQYPNQSYAYAYTKEMSFHILGVDESPLWIPTFYSQNIFNMTMLPGNSRALLRIRVDDTEVVRFSTDVHIVFQCNSLDEYFPYDAIACNYRLRSRHDVVIVARKISFDAYEDLTNRFTIDNSSLFVMSEDTLMPCEDVPDADEKSSCLEIHFILKRSMPYFNYVFYPPSLFLCFLSYCSLYFSVSATSFRVSINVTVILLHLKIYFFMGDNRFDTPTTVLEHFTLMEIWLVGCLAYSSVILFQYVLYVAKASFDTFYINWFHEANHVVRRVKMRDEKWEEARRSAFWNFLRWTTLKICHIYIRSSDDSLLDIISRFVYLVILIVLPLYFHLVYLPYINELMENYKVLKLEHIA